MSSTCVTADALLVTFFKEEHLEGHRLTVVLATVDYGPTATLTQDITLLLRVLQQRMVQEESETY